MRFSQPTYCCVTNLLQASTGAVGDSWNDAEMVSSGCNRAPSQSLIAAASAAVPMEESEVTRILIECSADLSLFRIAIAAWLSGCNAIHVAVDLRCVRRRYHACAALPCINVVALG